MLSLRRWIGRSTSKPWRSSTCTAPTRSSTSWFTRWTRSPSPKKPTFSFFSFVSPQKLSFYTEKATSISKGKPISVFGTSIWDETLYLAWSNVIQSLVPDSQRLQKQLNTIAELTECDELVLFERSTFLVLASSSNDLKLDSNRFEKISNTIKQFKLVTTCV
ncbi:Gtr1/RagA G protein [Blastocystis hominis]|uniref:Gtr1/RagA G protein n=1 Tax=Blastocystis hominis TaxID=12968 RepID=D8M6B5_BLAHO|nr:Gtr1/RagA G protein [Blastocystis hominis]CBK23668.2 Gtr1/RagA G protein [Blastocystis hominis]|eukprot:XP_012897716.1 Gtr1/RagA G protein [Blastocystis hominis]